MKIAVVKLTSASPISFSRKHGTPKLPRESDGAYEQRTWPEKLHYTKEGHVVVPAIMVKNTLTNVGTFLSEKVPGGRGTSTFAKHFKSGLLVLDDMVLYDYDGNIVLKKNVQSITLNVSARGKKGSSGGTRVDRTWPIVHEWQGEVKIYVLDPIITPDVFARHLDMSGKFVGFGRFRPQNGGTNGRYEAEVLSFGEETKEKLTVEDAVL